MFATLWAYHCPPRVHLNELAGNFEALGLRELREGVALGLNTEPGASLPGR
jgi:hypothetical protein